MTALCARVNAECAGSGVPKRLRIPGRRRTVRSRCRRIAGEETPRHADGRTFSDARDVTPLLDALFAPRGVAVVGASDEPSRIGGRPIHYMRRAGFAGALYPVNPRRETVQGLPAFPALDTLPGPVDVVVVAVPAPLVVETARQAAAIGSRVCLVFSSGFAEAGAEGAARQAELAAVARDTGMRVIGPNCLGMFAVASGFYPTFSSSLEASLPSPGGLSIASQSGAFGSHLAYLARERGLGLRTWISTGNESDVDVAELIGLLADDPETRVIMAHAEGVRDGARLTASLDRARAAGKPVLFMKVGRTAIGAAAAQSHTAALAGVDAVYDGVLAQHGAWRARTTEELVDVAYAASRGVLPASDRLGIVTISGGAGAMMADAADEAGLDVAPMPEAAQRRLKELLPFAAPRNPVDITAQAFNDMSLVTQNLRLMLAEGGYDMIVAFFTMVASAPMFVEPVRAALRAGLEGFEDRLVALCLLGPEAVKRRYAEDGLLVFEDAHRAIAALAALRRLAALAGRERRVPPVPPAAPLPAGPVTEPEALRLLAGAGIPVVPGRLVTSAAGAAEAAAALGGRVALKIVAAGIVHKTEAGGVALNVAPAAAAEAYAALVDRVRAQRPDAAVDGVLVSPMAADGVEMILGVQHDPVFGPVVMLGLGGILAEVFRDVAFRAAPFDAEEARRMIDGLRGRALLDGVRGAPPSDVDALAEAASRLSVFAASQAGRIESIDLNPVRVLPRGEGVVALDAYVQLRATPETVA